MYDTFSLYSSIRSVTHSTNPPAIAFPILPSRALPYPPAIPTNQNPFFFGNIFVNSRSFLLFGPLCGRITADFFPNRCFLHLFLPLFPLWLVEKDKWCYCSSCGYLRSITSVPHQFFYTGPRWHLDPCPLYVKLHYAFLGGGSAKLYPYHAIREFAAFLPYWCPGSVCIRGLVVSIFGAHGPFDLRTPPRFLFVTVVLYAASFYIPHRSYHVAWTLRKAPSRAASLFIFSFTIFFFLVS